LSIDPSMDPALEEALVQICETKRTPNSDPRDVRRNCKAFNIPL